MAVKSTFEESANPDGQKPKKSQKKRNIAIGVVFALFVLMYMVYVPQATIHYGVCKTYIELNEPYPEKLRYINLEDMGDVTRVYYRRTDPFGIVSINFIDCKFKVEDGTVTPYLSSVDINGKYRTYQAEEPARIDRFNVSIPAIIASHPDLSWPYFPLDDVKLYRDFHDDIDK